MLSLALGLLPLAPLQDDAPAAVGPPPMIEEARVFDAPVEEVYDAWTTAEGFAAVFPQSRLHRAELRPGGAYEIHWVPDAPEGERGSEGCEVLAVVPDRILSFTWNAPPAFESLRDERTQVVLVFEPLGESRTKLTLRHLDFGEGEEWAAVHEYFAGAWPRVLDGMVEAIGPPSAPMGWVLLLQPTREGFFDAPTPEEGAAIQQHFLRLLRMTREGDVLFAGPCTDEAGPGIVIFEAPDEAAARKVMEEDPAVAAGVFSAKLHPISFSLLRERDRRG